jgi:hypothetical protein
MLPSIYVKKMKAAQHTEILISARRHAFQRFVEQERVTQAFENSAINSLITTE